MARSIYFLLLAGHLAFGATNLGETRALRWVDTGSGLAIDALGRGGAVNLVKDVKLTVAFADGSSFTTSGVKRFETLSNARRVHFALAGSAAAEATVSADLVAFAEALTVAWRVACVGAKRELKSKKLTFTPAGPIASARTRAVNRLVVPTGAQAWEVAGDTPYRDFECQVREMAFAAGKFIVVTDWYDPDWIYEGNLAKGSGMNLPLTNGETLAGSFTTTFLAPHETDRYDDVDLAALAGQRSFSARVVCPAIGHAFDTGAPIRFAVRLRNVERAAREAALAGDVYDYYGAKLWSGEARQTLAPGESKEIPVQIAYGKRGMLFFAGTLSYAGRAEPLRAHFSVLPARASTNLLPDSPFGIASLNAEPWKYPDQGEAEASLALLQRMGVRWLRGNHGLSLKTPYSEEVLSRVRTTIGQTLRRGIMPFCEVQMPKSDDPGKDFPERIRTLVGTFAPLVPAPYFEFGNEVNLRKDRGGDYARNVLSPAFEITRQVAPGCKVMTMGFGGVDQKWMDEFLAAGGGKACDVYAIHPGCHPRAPEYVDADKSWRLRPQLDTTFAAAAQGGQSVWFTEMYSPTPPSRTQADLRTSADYLVRTYALSLARGVRVVNWYTFRDGTWFAQRQKSTDIEYSFGIVYADLTPKPQFAAYATMTEQLEGRRCEGRLDLGAEDLYGLRFGGREPVDLLWSYREKSETDLPWWPREKYADQHRRPGEPWVERWKAPVPVALPAAGAVTVTDLMGNATTVAAVGGKVTLSLTGSPVYVRGLSGMKTRGQVWLD